MTDEITEYRVRTGCDVTAVAEVADSLVCFGERYLYRVFTAAEVANCSGDRRVERLAARFAAKEAVIKALCEPDAAFPLVEIEVVNDGPLPTLRLTGSLAAMARQQRWVQTSISLSHTTCHAMATVNVLCRVDRKASDLESQSPVNSRAATSDNAINQIM